MRAAQLLRISSRLLLLASITCSLDGSLGPVKSAEFRSALARWNRQNIADYEFEYLRSCFCEMVEEMRVTVRNEVIVGAIFTRDQSRVPDVELAMIPTIPELFDIVREALEDADEVDVDYDRTFGHPTRVSIDWVENAVDDEVFYRVENLRTLSVR